MSERFIDRVKANPWPWAIFATAFLARLIYIIEKVINDPGFAYPMVDELWHWRWAQEILTVSFWGDDAYFRAPLYPYILAFFVKITNFLTGPGEAPTAQLFVIRTFQALIAGSTAALVYRFTKENFSHKIALFAGFAYALYGTLIYYETMLLIPVVFLFFTIAALLWFFRWYRDKSQSKSLVYAGLLFGLAAISRPNILVVMPLLGLVALFATTGVSQDLVARIKRAVIFTLAVCIPVFAVTLRNIIVTGETTLISTQGGVNLYLGNNPEATGLSMMMPNLPPSDQMPWNQFTAYTKRLAEREVGHALTPQEESEFWSGKATDYIFGNFGEFLTLTSKKIVYVVLGFENSDNGDIYSNRQYSILMSVLMWNGPIKFPWGVIFPLALVGIIAGWSQRKQYAPLYLFLLGYLPTILLFLVTARHRLPLLLVILPLAGVGLFFIIEKVRAANYKPLLAPGLVGLALLVLGNRTYFEIGGTNEMQILYHQGITFERRGEFDRALDSYLQALEYDPNSSEIWNGIGYCQWRLDRYEEAGRSFEHAIELAPDEIEALLNFGQMLMSTTAYDRALNKFERAAAIKPNDFRPLINIGDVYSAQGNFDMAEKYFKDAKEIAPEEKEIYFKMGELYARNKYFFEAEQNFKRGAYYGPPTPIASYNWGTLLMQLQRPGEALEKFMDAVRKNPRMKEAWLNVGIAHYKLRSPADSVYKYLNVALELDPNLQQAKDILQLMQIQGAGSNNR